MKSKPYKNYIKRPLEVLLAGCALLVIWPALLLTALLVRCKLGSPVLFRQERTGLHGKPFMLYKFRTMSNERDASGNLLPDELRLGSFGKTLRSLSLDELPGFWNILMGDMSLIGPHPLPTRYLPYYTREEMLRHDVRPGITGLAQVSGRNYVKWEDRFRIDLEYIHQLSFWLDLKILFKTVLVVLKRESIETASFIEHEGVIYRPLDVERSMNP